jgi:hypothetical protein
MSELARLLCLARRCWEVLRDLEHIMTSATANTRLYCKVALTWICGGAFVAPRSNSVERRRPCFAPRRVERCSVLQIMPADLSKSRGALRRPTRAAFRIVPRPRSMAAGEGELSHANSHCAAWNPTDNEVLEAGARGRRQRYSRDMPKKVISVPSVDYPEKTTAVAERHTRVICNIGRKRYALDFWSRASEIKPVAAEVLLFPAVPTAHKKVKKSTKPVFSP